MNGLLTKKVPKLIAVEGIIASGKSTLLKAWSDRTHFDRVVAVPEPINLWKDVRNSDKYAHLDNIMCSCDEDQPIKSKIDTFTETDTDRFNILKHMYDDGKRWSFTMQLWVLHTLSETLNKVMSQYEDNSEECPDVILMERSIYSSRIFAKIMKDMNHFSDMEWAMYQHLFNDYFMKSPSIDGIIFVDCPVTKATQRCMARHRRGEENGVTEPYQQLLYNGHLDMTNADRSKFAGIDCLTIDTERNFYADDSNLDTTIRQIDEFIFDLSPESSNGNYRSFMDIPMLLTLENMGELTQRQSRL